MSATVTNSSTNFTGFTNGQVVAFLYCSQSAPEAHVQQQMNQSAKIKQKMERTCEQRSEDSGRLRFGYFRTVERVYYTDRGVQSSSSRNVRTNDLSPPRPHSLCLPSPSLSYPAQCNAIQSVVYKETARHILLRTTVRSGITKPNVIDARGPAKSIVNAKPSIMYTEMFRGSRNPA